MDFVYQQLINGAWQDAINGGTWNLINPATEETIRELPFGDAADANAAIEAAAAAFPKWARKTPYQRGDILKRAADLIREHLSELARITTLESGKPLGEARGEWSVTADLFEWYAEEGKRAYGEVIPTRHLNKRRLTLLQPLGVVGVITAWNFPSYNPARAASAALGAGCTVVIRPSEYTPMSAMAMVSLLQEAGIPKGVVNLINGDAASMGQAMLDHPQVRRISFTGSTRVGRILMEGAGRTFTRLGLELGGSAPVIVMPDVDIAQVAKQGVVAKLRNNGQVCVSPQRFMVHSQIMEDFVEASAEAMQSVKVGDGLDSDTDVGPLINAAQRERLEALLRDATAKGAQIITGGKRPAGFERGYFFEPTLLANITPEQDLAHQEIFGPLMPITAFDDPEQALDMANNTEYGLAAFVFTRDLSTAIKLYEGLEFGMVGVNDWYPQVVEAPFPGWKGSGLGVEGGAAGLREYMETKLVTLGL